MKRVLFAVAFLATTPLPAVAQFYTTTPRIGGGWVTTPDVSPNYGGAGVGERWVTTPNGGGSYSTTNNLGGRWTSSPRIGGGWITTPNR